MKWKHPQLVQNEMETFAMTLERNGNVHKLFGIKWKQSQLVENEMETVTSCFEWSGNIHN